MKRILRLAVVLFLTSFVSTCFAQGTAFTYQGQLTFSSAPANGNYDFAFGLYTAPTLGTLVGAPKTNLDVLVADGLFTTTLDFGASPWTGQTLYLEILVRTNGGTTFIALSPLQEITSAPYAITASNLSGSLPAGQISGAVASANLTGTYGNPITLNNAGNSFTGNGAGLTSVNAFTLNGLGASNFWQLQGNAGTTPGLNFLGTTDNQPLELHADGMRALRLEVGGPSLFAGNSTPTGAPNVIGGSIENSVAPGTVGSFIGGGGATNFQSYVYVNSIGAYSDFSVIGGGNIIAIQSNSVASVIGGGGGNTIMSDCTNATIVGGLGNTIEMNSSFAFIGGGNANGLFGDNASSVIAGGYYNYIGSNSYYSVIGGGPENYINSNSPFSTIAGGYDNYIQTNCQVSTITGGFQNSVQVEYSFIGGGEANSINIYSDHSAIGGGWQNTMGSNVYEGTIAGGYVNAILADSAYSTIAGGQYNTIQGDSDDFGSSFIGGGASLTIYTNSNDSVICGGEGNSISNNSDYCVIGGGDLNQIGNNDHDSTIAGGYVNVILDSADYSAISGGLRNVIYGDIYNYGTGFIGGGYSDIINTNSWNSVICGGENNSVSDSSPNATVGGGFGNTAGGQYSTIPGGENNTTSADNSFAAGTTAVADQSGEFVWADASPYTFDPYTQPAVNFPGGVINSFNIRATGGFFVALGVNTSGLVTSQMDLDSDGSVTFKSGSSASDQSVSWSPGNGSWSFSSDRNLKDRFEKVEAESVLDKVAQLPVVEWSYKGYPQRHIGTMAQDFHALFPLNDKDTVLNDSDLHGVELAAIKGLNQKVNEQDAQMTQMLEEKDSQIQTLKAQNDSLAQRLNELEAAVKKLSARK